MAGFDIVLLTRASLHPDGEPDEYVYSVSGIITCTDEIGAVSRVGKLTALRVHAGLAQDAGGVPVRRVRRPQPRTPRPATLLYEPDGYSFREELVRRFDAVGSDLLVLDYVVLAPQWRRLRLGLLAVRKAVDLIGGGCGLAVSLVAPLRPGAARLLRVPAGWIPRNTTKQQRREAAVKLRWYFRAMGFRRLGQAPYYALPLNQVTPSAAELLEGV